MDRHYDVLGVSPDAKRSEIRRAYRALLKEHHPDQGGSRERFLRIKEAYEEVTGEVAPDAPRLNGGSVEPAAGSGVEPGGGTGVDPTFEPDEPVVGHGLTVRGDLLTLTLSGLVHDLELSSIVDDPILNADVRRPVAFFEVRNATDRALPWRGRRRTRFIGDDGFMYEASSIVRPHVDKLPGRWCGSGVDVGSGRALEAIVIAQELPPEVAIEQVVYTQQAHDPGGRTDPETERYLFEIRDRVRNTLDEVPFDRDGAE